MTAADTRIDFAAIAARVRDAVRAVAAADPAPDDPYRGLYLTDELALTLGAEQAPLQFEQRFDLVCERLDLDGLDRAVLAACVAPEVHPDFGRIFGYLHDDLTRRDASPRLVATLLAGPGVTVADVLVCFDRAARLITSGALRLDSGGPLADRAVTVAPQLAAWLLGANLADAGRLRRVDPSPLPLGREPVVARVAALLRGDRRLPLILSGDDALLVLAAAAGAGVVVLDAASATREDAAADLAITAALEQRVPVIDALDDLSREGRERAIDRLIALPSRPVLQAARGEELLALGEHPAMHVTVPLPSALEREAAWHAAIGGDVATGAIAARFRLDVTRIADAAHAARAEADARGVEIDGMLLAHGARTASSRRISELAQLLAPGPGWQDLVLPERALTALHTLSSFVCNRDRVLREWGYERIVRGRGLTALFAGESGTGKTLAARVVAHAAGLDVYRVDLSGLFSKWVGETEKNLDRIFRVAEGSNAVLFFDEADAVFGRRTGVGDASDRYANLETAFLLQRIEEYPGVVVLATNLRSNMDEAFVRRIDVVVDFPPPKGPTRRLLWDTLLPAEVPRSDDLDLDFLAERFELTGGGIRNCAVAAALLAAENGAVIEMRHLVRAIGMEYAKLGRLTLEADFEHFHPLLEGA